MNVHLKCVLADVQIVQNYKMRAALKHLYNNYANLGGWCFF